MIRVCKTNFTDLPKTSILSKHSTRIDTFLRINFVLIIHTLYSIFNILWIGLCFPELETKTSGFHVFPMNHWKVSHWFLCIVYFLTSEAESLHAENFLSIYFKTLCSNWKFNKLQFIIQQIVNKSKLLFVLLGNSWKMFPFCVSDFDWSIINLEPVHWNVKFNDQIL